MVGRGSGFVALLSALVLGACSSGGSSGGAGGAAGSSGAGGSTGSGGSAGAAGGGGSAGAAGAAGCQESTGDFDVAFGHFVDVASDGVHAWIMLEPYGDLNEDAAFRAYVYDPDLGMQKGSFSLDDTAERPVLAWFGSAMRAYWIEGTEIRSSEIDASGAPVGTPVSVLSPLPSGNLRIDDAGADTSGGALVLSVNNQELHVLELDAGGAASGALAPLGASSGTPAQVARFSGTTAIVWNDTQPSIWLALGNQAPVVLKPGSAFPYAWDLLVAGSDGFALIASDTSSTFDAEATLTWFDAQGSIIKELGGQNTSLRLAAFDDDLATARGSSGSTISHCSGDFTFDTQTCDDFQVSNSDPSFSRIVRVEDGWVVAFGLSTGGSDHPRYRRLCDPE